MPFRPVANTATTSRTETVSSISSRDSEVRASSKRDWNRTAGWPERPWLDRVDQPPEDWLVCLRPLRYTAIVAMASETAITGTSMERATRSAVRWRNHRSR